jgi:tRNA threonylcarbamoyladenosine biosynthesis protein TsaB
VADVITLVLEASTYRGSAAVVDGATLVGEREVAMRGREHEALMPAVAELLGECGLSPRELRRIVCGAGPGSFTSLRIAGSIAKGLAVASGAALVPVSSLALLVGSVEGQGAGRYLAAIDAMRGEHYVQLFEIAASGVVSEVGPLGIVASASVDGRAAELAAVAVGPDRLEGRLVSPLARGAAHITNMIEAAEPADLASWEPAYGRLAEAQVKWEATHGRPLQLG